MSIYDKIKAIIAKEVEAIHNIPVADNGIEEAVAILHERIHVKGGKVIMTGVGKAGEIGRNIATTFCSTGTPAVFLSPLEAVHGDLGMLQKNDVLFAISNSGKTREILELIPLAKDIVSDLPVIALTGFPDRPISELSDVTLCTGMPEEVCLLKMTPTTSTTVMTVIGDILIVLLMEKIAFTQEAYAQRHHGGYLGAKAKGLV